MQFKQLTIPAVKVMIKKASVLELEIVYLPLIMERQTWEEKAQEATKENNGVGLNGVDAKFVTSVFKQVRAEKHLSFKQAASLRKVLVKYAGQYVDIAEENKVRMMQNGAEVATA